MRSYAEAHTDGFIEVFGPRPRLGLVRSLMTTKASRGTGGLMTTKTTTKTLPTPCTKTFTCEKSYDGSYALPGFTAYSFITVLCCCVYMYVLYDTVG